ncbi:AAA family ATPase [Aeromonas sp. 55A]|uniref:AAA family ATPase n=1 Tax=Aeromonas sp. 55A TaxID=3452720 RepID=UPI003F795A48
MLNFIVLDKKSLNSMNSKNTVYLTFSIWNDYSYRTLFNMHYMDLDGKLHSVGQIKIGFQKQNVDVATLDKIQKEFKQLNQEFFSLAESPEFYENLYSIDERLCKVILERLNCVVLSKKSMDIAKNEDVFKKSLLRDVNINTIHGQFLRIINGDSPLTEFDFQFVRANHSFSDLNIEFNVDPYSLPPSNIHAIIGRNGLGKTTLLNEMVNSIVGKEKPENAYFEEAFSGRITDGYFSTVISVSFSAFDPFTPISEQSDPFLGTCYYYIGLKKNDCKEDSYELENIRNLREKCAISVYNSCADDSKRDAWLKAINNLESDTNFRDLNLTEIVNLSGDKLVNECINRMEKMSSGHAIVFMIISSLVEKVQDKTLVLFDEPESHLHPPLLAAFIRALSNLLSRRNGIAIIATHSPVVVQEIPKSCCWVLTRFGDEMIYARPSIETFAENVGTLTKEVFKLEMEQSGFHKLLKEQVDEGVSFKEVMRKFNKQIGFEGQAILMSMIMLRDKNVDIKDLDGYEHE